MYESMLSFHFAELLGPLRSLNGAHDNRSSRITPTQRPLYQLLAHEHVIVWSESVYTCSVFMGIQPCTENTCGMLGLHNMPYSVTASFLTVLFTLAGSN